MYVDGTPLLSLNAACIFGIPNFMRAGPRMYLYNVINKHE